MTKEIKSNYKVIGVMAGSSMDGLDVAEVLLTNKRGWTFELGKYETIRYDSEIEELLKSASDKDSHVQKNIDVRFGKWIGNQMKTFGLHDCDLIAVHGHTLIHAPEESVSWQLGRGDVIAAMTQTPVVTEFRSLDVRLGGQGAPLVPVGDFELFKEYDACLNLGGIANVSIKNERMAWDICPCNQVLNSFAQKLGHAFDSRGKLAKSGKVVEEWLEEVAKISFFKQSPPKSLSNSFMSPEMLQKIDALDGLSTYTKFIADQIVSDLEKSLPPNSKVLVTGGGAHNDCLMDLLVANKTGIKFQLPKSRIIEFKEAIIFAFLGLLKLRNETNVLASVTGASKDSSSGVIHYPK